MVFEKHKSMRKSLTNTPNHIAYKYIHVYMQVHINYQKFLKHAFRKYLCGYLTSTELKITEKPKFKGISSLKVWKTNKHS